ASTGSPKKAFRYPGMAGRVAQKRLFILIASAPAIGPTKFLFLLSGKSERLSGRYHMIRKEHLWKRSGEP
ncbi:MAG TPA: hypothetical protein DDZ65_14185, partial [Firmicutes bacterium]|nr:hypothetical protein [Bacillota bacterium]